MTALLVLTIGQSPRPDLVAELLDALDPVQWSAEAIEVRGALDGLTLSEIQALAPASDADVLHTRLPEGTDVVVSKRAVTERLTDLLASESGDRPVLVACTGTFDRLGGRASVLFPSRVLDGAIDACLPPGSTLGVLVPLAEQVDTFASARSRADRPAVAAAVLPGADPHKAATQLREAGVDLIVLDCFGYDRALLQQVRQITGVPVLSAVRVTAALVAELVGGPCR